MVLEVDDGKVRKSKGDARHPANFGKLCSKGLTVSKTIAAKNRLTRYYKRLGSQKTAMVELSSEQALDEISDKLSKIRDEFGGDSIAFYLSGQISTEVQYVANKLAKGYLRSNHVDSNSRLCMASAAVGYKKSFGADAPMGSYQDIEHADTMLIIGSNMADCHPILFQRVLAQQKKGARLIVVDPRRTESAKEADLYLPIAPGRDLSLLVGWLRYFVEQDVIDREFISQSTAGWNDWEQEITINPEFSLEAVAEQTGLDAADIIKAAEWMMAAKGLMSFWAMGLNQSRRGTHMTSAINNLHLALGKLGTLGNTPFSLTGQPNAMGGREVGYLVNALPGQRAVMVKEDREFTEKIWNVPADTIRPEPGAHAVNMFRKIKSGEIKAIWVIGTNPIASMPNNQEVKEAFEHAELVIVQDAYHPTETAEYADYLLPGAIWAEAEGTMTNSDRHVTLMQQAVEPPGDTTADWKIVTEVAQRMGYRDAFTYQDAESIFSEFKQFINPLTGWDLSGITYKKLAQEGAMQWPYPEGATTGTARRYVTETGFQFAFPDGKARIVQTPLAEAPLSVNTTYPLVLTTGRLPHHWHTMTKTGQVDALKKLNDRPFLHIHNLDAQKNGIEKNDWVSVESIHGRAELPVLIDDQIRPGTCFSPIHWNDVYGEKLCINEATSPEVDPYSFQPELKYMRVRIAKIEAKNYRFFKQRAETTPMQEAYQEGLLAGQAASGFSVRQKQILAEQFMAGFRLL